MDRGARRWVTNFSLSVLIRCHYRQYFRHHFIIIIRRRRNEKKNLPAGGMPETHTQTGSSRIFKRMVPADYSYQRKKEVSRNFPCTCPVTALPVYYRRRLTLCTALWLHLSTWSPRFTSRDRYMRCRSLASRAKHSFYFGSPKIIGSNSKSITALIA